MAKVTVKPKVQLPNLVAIPKERSEFQMMLAKNPNYFGNITGSKLKPILKMNGNVTYEKITCVGYNPDTKDMEAVIAIQRSNGYGGALCAAGTFEHIRFYIDYHDGNGYVDQGVVAINVHDIPAAKDCANASIFPITYVATLKRQDTKAAVCDKPITPTVRAILSWQSVPPANAPNWTPVWGNVAQADVVLKPKPKLQLPLDFDFNSFFDLAVKFPELSNKKLTEITGFNIKDLNPKQLKLNLDELIKVSTAQKIPASRFAFKSAINMMKFPTSEITLMEKKMLADVKIDIAKIIDQLSVLVPKDATKANVDYEELECVGLDNQIENLVATIRVKKKAGYSGSLCTAGSKEYISFWIDWNNDCQWEYLNTMQINVHDINMPNSSLCYSVAMPLDTTFKKKLCKTPNVVRVRAVLSWNTPPSTSDANKLEFYGNRVDTHVQIKPGTELDPNNLKALYTIIGGIDVSHVDDATGLTKPGSFFAYNGLAVPTSAPFGGEIVINGPSFPGKRYRIKLTNLTTGVSNYLGNTISNLVGWLPVAPYVQFTDNIPEIGTGYYNYLDNQKNILNILARFSPGTNDQYLVELEIEGVAGSFAKTIQMDHNAPAITLHIDDNGDCTFYKKGDTITGHFSVEDEHLNSWSLASTWGITTPAVSNGVTNTPIGGIPFTIVTPANTAFPCGAVSLHAVDKTIVNSQSVGYHSYAGYNICL
jgi:hypothetical protein